MSDRFTLEEEFMKCWAVTDDIDILGDMISDISMSSKDMDRLLNCVGGLKTLYDYKFQKTFKLVEELIRNGNLT
jgi:hypothetical protein